MHGRANASLRLHVLHVEEHEISLGYLRYPTSENSWITHKNDQIVFCNKITAKIIS